jgi:hypothetical protein
LKKKTYVRYDDNRLHAADKACKTTNSFSHHGQDHAWSAHCKGPKQFWHNLEQNTSITNLTVSLVSIVVGNPGKIKKEKQKKKIFQEEKKQEKADFPVALYS